MFRHFAPLLALTVALPQTASAGLTSDGVAGVTVEYISPSINLSVANVSGSLIPSERVLEVVSSDTEFDYDAYVWCAYPKGAVSSNVAYGYISMGIVGYVDDQNFPFSATYDNTPRRWVDYTNDMGQIHLTETLPLPESWDGRDFIGFNPVVYVEEAIENSNLSAAEFLRQDHVFEINLRPDFVAVCEADFGGGDTERFLGTARADLTLRLMVHGDPDMKDEPVVIGDVAAPIPTAIFIGQGRSGR
ncbi:MAG: hypothetical protein AAFV53_10160 [Myxococcota bacterium]